MSNQDDSDSTYVPFWAWPNVLSLDAVAVGLLWLMIFTFQFCGRMLHLFELGIVGLSIWMVYTADRLLDSAGLDHEKPHSLRHRFHSEHRKQLRLAWFSALVLNTGLVVNFATESQLRWGSAAIAIVIGYVMSVQLSTPSARWIPKELHAGMVFSFGVSLVAWSEMDPFDFAPLLISTLMAGFLFATNCLSIACWEQEWDRHQNFDSSVTRCPIVHRLLPTLIFIQATVAVCLFASGWLPLLVTLCLISSNFLLMGLSLLHRDRWFGKRSDSVAPGSVRFRVALADATLVIPPIVFATAQTVV
jgi:hypothetical protein